MLQYKRSTIKEVAQVAGVSTMTVSRVINGRPDVAPQTRQRVRQVIQQLGYQPSALARSLIQQRSYTLGVVVAGLKYLGPSRTLNGIAAKAETMGYSLLLKELPHFDTRDITPIFQSLLARHVDGIIWAVPQIGDNHAWLQGHCTEQPVPMVFLTMESWPELPVVAVDNYLGGRLATRHLLEQGYQRIGHLAGPLEWWEARQRLAGWQAALQEAGLPALDTQWVEGNWSSSSGAQAILQLFSQYPEMEAVFVANDQMALSALQAAHRRGRQVPQDLGVIGFDGMPEAAYFWPPLTTVAQDQQALGSLAVQQLVDLIEAHQAGQSLDITGPVLLEPGLVIRESTRRLS